MLRYAKYEPQVLQVELHPYLSQEALVKLCKTLGIALTAYSSFGPQSYLELGMGKGSPSLLEHHVISNIAAAHDKSKLFHTQHVMSLISGRKCPGLVAMGNSTRDRRHSEEQQHR